MNRPVPAWLLAEPSEGPAGYTGAGDTALSVGADRIAAPVTGGAAEDAPAPVSVWLEDGLMRARAALDSTAPILRHLVLGEERELFGEAVIARVRGMAEDLAAQLGAAAVTEGEALPPALSRERLVPVIAANAPLLGALHALALEWQLAERLAREQALDPVLSPLLQAQLASAPGGGSGVGAGRAASALLDAEARHCQHQRRMHLPLAELPPDLFQIALRIVHASLDDSPAAAAIATRTERHLRAALDPSRTRQALLRRFFDEAPWLLVAGLDLARAGVGLFVTALARVARIPRDEAILLTNPAQAVRLLLVLRAAGAPIEMARASLAVLHPALLPELAAGLSRIALEPQQAMQLLAEAGLAP